jgi:hypothetical protein
MASEEIGTWSVDVAHSTWHPTGRKPQSETLTIEDWSPPAGRLKITSTRTFASGPSPIVLVTDKRDDGVYRALVSSQNPHQNIDKCAYSKTSDIPLKFTFSRINPGGDEVAHGTIVMSPDNKTRTVTVLTHDGKIRNVVMYKKVESKK